MAIRFPPLHIATSVVNRILNVADDLDGKGRPPQPIPNFDTPQPADPSLEGVQLNTQLMQPTQPSAAPDDATAQDITLRPLL